MYWHYEEKLGVEHSHTAIVNSSDKTQRPYNHYAYLTKLWTKDQFTNRSLFSLQQKQMPQEVVSLLFKKGCILIAKTFG